MNLKLKNLSNLKFIFILLSSIISNTFASEELKTELLKKINSGIPGWMDEQISKDLAHAPKEGITKKLTEVTFKSNPSELALYHITNGVVSVDCDQSMTEFARKNLVAPIENFVKELSSYVKLPDVQFLHYVWDSPSTGPNGAAYNSPHVIFSNYQIPVFASCKITDEKNVVVIPDPWTLLFIKDGSLVQTKLGNLKYPWSQKHSKAIWRGMTTGGHYAMGTYERFPRFKLVQLSSKFPEILDAKFNSIYTDEDVKNLFFKLKYVAENHVYRRSHAI